MRLLDLTGHRYGLLTVVERAGLSGGKYPRPTWKCLCDCGAEVVKSTLYLREKQRVRADKSCGCDVEHYVTHGMTGTPEHRAWLMMIKRCETPSATGFSDYGGRGIKVAPEWRHDFEAFYAHVGPRPSDEHSLDRIDTDGDYAPGNVRWVTIREQNNNRRPRRWGKRPAGMTR